MDGWTILDSSFENKIVCTAIKCSKLLQFLWFKVQKAWNKPEIISSLLHL